jgi:hypothetical protein
MLQLLKTRRARRAAVATICPFVERSRWKLHEISESAWLDPYMVGFLSMLITLVAKHDAGDIDGEALGLVQLAAWKEITQTDIDDIGGEICLLSASGDSAFQNGCDNAAILYGALKDAAFEPQAEPGTDYLQQDSESVAVLWARLFEDRIRASADVR